MIRHGRSGFVAGSPFAENSRITSDSAGSDTHPGWPPNPKNNEVPCAGRTEEISRHCGMRIEIPALLVGALLALACDQPQPTAAPTHDETISKCWSMYASQVASRAGYTLSARRCDGPCPEPSEVEQHAHVKGAWLETDARCRPNVHVLTKRTTSTQLAGILEHAAQLAESRNAALAKAQEEQAAAEALPVEQAAKAQAEQAAAEALPVEDAGQQAFRENVELAGHLVDHDCEDMTDSVGLYLAEEVARELGDYEASPERDAVIKALESCRKKVAKRPAPRPAPRPSSPSYSNSPVPITSGPNCSTGKPCGNSCIARSKTCHK